MPNAGAHGELRAHDRIGRPVTRVVAPVKGGKRRQSALVPARQAIAVTGLGGRCALARSRDEELPVAASGGRDLALHRDAPGALSVTRLRPVARVAAPVRFLPTVGHTAGDVFERGVLQQVRPRRRGHRAAHHLADRAHDRPLRLARGEPVEKGREIRFADRVGVGGADVVEDERHPATAVLLGVGDERLELGQRRRCVDRAGGANVVGIPGRDRLGRRAACRYTPGGRAEDALGDTRGGVETAGAAGHDRLDRAGAGGVIGSAERVGERGHVVAASSERRKIVADLVSCICRRERGQVEVIDRVPADLVSVRCQAADLSPAEKNGGVHRAAVQVEGRVHPVVFQQVASCPLADAPVVERERDNGPVHRHGAGRRAAQEDRGQNACEDYQHR